MGAAVQVPDPSLLSAVLRYLFRNPALCRSLGDAARNLVENELNPMDRIRQTLSRLGDPPDSPNASAAIFSEAATVDARPLRQARE